MDIRGLTVHELWIEGASQIASEYYASVVFDRSAKAPLVMLSTKGGMDIEQVADEDPDAIARAARRPAARVPGLPWPPAGVRGRRRRRRRAPGRRDARQAVRRLHRRGGDARRGQPADRHARERDGVRRSTRRSRSTATRSTATPRTPQLRDLSQRGPAGADGQGARPHLRQARRRHRHPRQRRRAGDVDARRRRPGRRRARQLPRRRRRLEGRGDHERGRGDPLRPEGQGGAVQHLRRHHPLRRGRARA